MKKELETPLNEAIDSCNIQRKQYQHTNKQLLTSNMSTFSTRPVTRRKRRSWGEDGGQLRNIEVILLWKFIENFLKYFCSLGEKLFVMYEMGSITNSDGGVPPIRIIAIDFRQDNWIRKVQIKLRDYNFLQLSYICDNS